MVINRAYTPHAWGDHTPACEAPPGEGSNEGCAKKRDRLPAPGWGLGPALHMP